MGCLIDGQTLAIYQREPEAECTAVVLSFFAVERTSKGEPYPQGGGAKEA